MKGTNNLDRAIDGIHKGIDTLLNDFYQPSYVTPEKLSPNFSLRKAHKAKLKVAKTFSFERTKKLWIRELFYSPNKWPAKEDYYQSVEWKSFRKLIIEQFPHKRGIVGCSICLKRTRHPIVHHVYGLSRAVFQLLCKQCHDDHHYIIKTTKRLKKKGVYQTAT